MVHFCTFLITDKLKLVFAKEINQKFNTHYETSALKLFIFLLSTIRIVSIMRKLKERIFFQFETSKIFLQIPFTQCTVLYQYQIKTSRRTFILCFDIFEKNPTSKSSFEDSEMIFWYPSKYCSEDAYATPDLRSM